MDKGVEYFLEGYNCAQSVFLAYAEKYGFDKETALKISSSFGGGMGRLREVCGAVSAMFAIIGLESGYTSPNNHKTKTEHYKHIQALAEKFKAEHGSIVCRELLGTLAKTNSYVPEKRTEEYYKVRPCVKFVKTACEILDKELSLKS